MREGRSKEVDCEAGQGWAAVYQAVAKKMLDYSDNSEMLKVNTRELELHVLAQKEPNVNIEHIVMQASGEGDQRLFQAFNRQERKSRRQLGKMGGTSKDDHHTGLEEPGTLPSD